MKPTLRLFAAALTILLVFTAVGARAGDDAPGLEEFPVRHGDLSSPKIAITMDDVNEPEWVWKCVELCEQYGIAMTFFPNGVNMKEEDREKWQAVVDSGCEIGSHGYYHERFKDNGWQVLYNLGLFEEQVDKVLGYHYEVRWFRPTWGTIEDSNGSMYKNMTLIKRCGYSHILLWNVSETDPKKAIKQVKNGGILLYHARKKDYECLETLIPQLLDAGFEPVTVSELFDFDPPETSGELFVYDGDTYGRIQE